MRCVCNGHIVPWFWSAVCCQQVLSEGVTFNGRMDLSDKADNTFCLLEYYGAQGAQPPAAPYHVYFARWVCSLTFYHGFLRLRRRRRHCRGYFQCILNIVNSKQLQCWLMTFCTGVVDHCQNL